MIQISINNEKFAVPEQSTLSDALTHLQIETKGIAVAIHEQIVPKADWSTHIVQQNQEILIIKATQGG